MNTSIIKVLPDYEPKNNEFNSEKVDLNIRDLQAKYPFGCICCGNKYAPKKYSSMIASHFNTTKHKKNCLLPANKQFLEDFGSSNNLPEAFDNKCKEVRSLKKLIYEYKDELETLKIKYKKLEELNINLQQNIINTSKPKFVECKDLIDLIDKI